MLKRLHSSPDWLPYQLQSVKRPPQLLHPPKAMSSSTHSVTHLISFDVDGTLIRSVGENANKLHKRAFSHGFKKVFGLDTDIEVVKHHGSTDPLIVLAVLEHHGVAKEEALSKLKEVQDAMIEFFLANKSEAANGLQILPGVIDLLTRLKSMPHVATCLVTGNLEPIGWSKMEALGLAQLFSEPRFGGFSTDYCSGIPSESWRDRGAFCSIAAEKLRARLGDAALPPFRFHVGDTPNDILAPLEAGFKGVGVCTGIFNNEQLLASVPAGKEGDVVVLESLEDVQAALRAFNL